MVARILKHVFAYLDVSPPNSRIRAYYVLPTFFAQGFAPRIALRIPEMYWSARIASARLAPQCVSVLAGQIYIKC